MESLTQPPIGEISKACLETVWKYLLLLIILQKNSFREKVEDSDVRPDCLQMRPAWVSPVVSMKNKRLQKIGFVGFNYIDRIVIRVVYCNLVIIWGLPNLSHRWKVLQNEIF